MGQYWMPVNLTKGEFIDPHKLASGLKLWEQLAAPHVGRALVILCAAMPEPRGGGDFDLAENWHGPERTFPEHNITPGPMPESYPTIAARTIGRWAGDRIALVGDYAADTDLQDTPIPASQIYGACVGPDDDDYGKIGTFRDVTEDVCAVIEHELGGKFVGDGWREYKDAHDEPPITQAA